MGTANFRMMEYNMPLVVGGIDFFHELKENFENEYNEEYTEDAFYYDQEEEYREAFELAEEFTENLKYHNITVISGYYNGFQFYVEEKHNDKFDLDKSSKYCIENDDANYYFNVCRSLAIREADREKRKINRWLESLVKYGYEILVCIGNFSNGEAIYEIRTPKKTKM